MDLHEWELFCLHKLLKALRALPTLERVDMEEGIIRVPTCPDGCCAEQMDLGDAVRALEWILNIERLTTEEVEAEKNRRFEEGRKKFFEDHPECLSENARGPKDRETK